MRQVEGFGADGDPTSVIYVARKRIIDNLEILDGLVPGSATCFNKVRVLFSKLCSLCSWLSLSFTL